MRVVEMRLELQVTNEEMEELPLGSSSTLASVVTAQNLLRLAGGAPCSRQIQECVSLVVDNPGLGMEVQVQYEPRYRTASIALLVRRGSGTPYTPAPPAAVVPALPPVPPPPPAPPATETRAVYRVARLKSISRSSPGEQSPQLPPYDGLPSTE